MKFSTYIAALLSLTGILNAGSVLAAEPLKGGVEKVDTAPIYGGLGGGGKMAPMLQSGAEAEFSRPLNGQMEFSEQVAPVDPAFKPHKLFALDNLPPEGTEDGWYQIPAWRAGKFHRESQTNHTLFGDVTIQSKVDHVYGMQLDKRGGIWHHESWPKVTKVDMDGYAEYKIIHTYQPVSITAEEFVIKAFSTDIDVDPATGKIKRVTKQEDFNKYYPCRKGIACADCTTLGFSQYGRINTTKEQSTLEEVLVEPFQVINKFRGMDLKASFIRYLKSHDMPDLIPD